jgi:hypothetical protein
MGQLVKHISIDHDLEKLVKRASVGHALLKLVKHISIVPINLFLEK